MSDASGKPGGLPRAVIDQAVAAVEAARGRGAAALADAAIAAFNVAFAGGDVALATRMLEEAERASHAAGNRLRQCQTLTWLARLARMQMKLERAEQLARRAVRLVEQKAVAPDAVRDAWTEVGDIALLRTLSAEADAAFARALEVEGTTAPQACVLLDKRAQAARQAGRPDDAIAFLREAERRSRESGGEGDARFARVCQATVYQLDERWAEAQALLDPLAEEARATGDFKTLATALNLRATCKRALDGTEAALADALDARRAALQAVDPLAYVQSAVLIAELYEAEGNRLRALEAILTGRATLGDLLGRELATQFFAPAHDAMKARWGAEYDSISDAYIRERKARRPS